MNVLLSSSGNKVPLLLALKDAVKRISGNGIVTAGDINSNVLTRYLCDKFWQMPSTVESNISEIVTRLKRQNITHILPTRDGELLFWARLKDSLRSQGIHVIVADENAVIRCLDKLQFGQDQALGIIPSYLDLTSDIHKSTNARFVVKERFGSGSGSVGINLSQSAAIAHASDLSSPIYQPFISGQEISVDAWLTKNHEVKAAMCRVRELVINGESQVTYTLPESPYLPQITTVLSSLKLSGPIVLQAIVQQGECHIVECNSRFGGASTLGIKAGVDSLFWSLCESIGKDTKALPISLSTQQIRQVRVATDLYL